MLVSIIIFVLFHPSSGGDSIPSFGKQMANTLEQLLSVLGTESKSLTKMRAPLSKVSV